MSLPGGATWIQKNGILRKRSAGVVYPYPYSASPAPPSAGLSAGAFASASSEYLSITDAAQTGLNPGTGDFSVFFWARSASVATTQRIIAKGAAANSNIGWSVLFITSTIKAYIDDGTTEKSRATGTVLDDTWYAFLASYDRDGNLTVYHNAETALTTDISTAADTVTTADPFHIGARTSTPGTYLNGLVYGAAFWTRALSASDFTELYNGGTALARSAWSAGLATSLVSCWLDDADSSLTADTEGTNTLTNNNTVTVGDGPNV